MSVFAGRRAITRELLLCVGVMMSVTACGCLRQPAAATSNSCGRQTCAQAGWFVCASHLPHCTEHCSHHYRHLVHRRPNDLRYYAEKYGPVKDVYLPKDFYSGCVTPPPAQHTTNQHAYGCSVDKGSSHASTHACTHGVAWWHTHTHPSSPPCPPHGPLSVCVSCVCTAGSQGVWAL